MNAIIQQITDALVPLAIAAAVAGLGYAIRLLRAKANATDIGAQAHVDDLFFDEIQGAVDGLATTAASWKKASGGQLTDVQKADLRQKAIDQAVKNLQQHGEDFIKKLPMQAAEDWVSWYVEAKQAADPDRILFGKDAISTPPPLPTP